MNLQLQDQEGFEAFRHAYRAAIKEVRTKIEILSEDFAVRHDYNPIHHIESRLKTTESIEEKLMRLDKEISIASAKENLFDIAGIRVVCNFIDDVYAVADMLTSQSDVRLLTEKDYIKNPKPNGYRSFHVIIAVPVYYLDTMEYFPVEIQLRTMTMDLWASMEHRVCYKKLPEHREELAEAFCQYADILGRIEKQFEAYNETRMLEEITPSEVAEAPAEERKWK